MPDIKELVQLNFLPQLARRR